MNVKESAIRALQFVDEGRAMAAAAIDKLETADLKSSNALVHEFDHALTTIETGRQILNAVMVLASASHQASALPSERSVAK